MKTRVLSTESGKARFWAPAKGRLCGRSSASGPAVWHERLSAERAVCYLAVHSRTVQVSPAMRAADPSEEEHQFGCKSQYQKDKAYGRLHQSCYQPGHHDCSHACIDRCSCCTEFHFFLPPAAMIQQESAAINDSLSGIDRLNTCSLTKYGPA